MGRGEASVCRVSLDELFGDTETSRGLRESFKNSAPVITPEAPETIFAITGQDSLEEALLGFQDNWVSDPPANELRLKTQSSFRPVKALLLSETAQYQAASGSSFKVYKGKVYMLLDARGDLRYLGTCFYGPANAPERQQVPQILTRHLNTAIDSVNAQPRKKAAGKGSSSAGYTPVIGQSSPVLDERLVFDLAQKACERWSE